MSQDDNIFNGAYNITVYKILRRPIGRLHQLPLNISLDLIVCVFLSHSSLLDKNLSVSTPANMNKMYP